MKLPPQVFVSHTKPEPHLIEPVTGVKEDMFFKPRKGGMWTSSFDEEGGEWVRWLGEQEQYLGSDYALESPRWGGKLWLLQPAEANVYAIPTPDELRALHARFPLPVPETLSELSMFRYMVNWEEVAREYDAVHIPNPWPWRLGMDEASMFFYVMDAECTCWFEWCFEGEPQLLDSVTTERR